jgi:hypothetical protein
VCNCAIAPHLRVQPRRVLHYSPPGYNGATRAQAIMTTWRCFLLYSLSDIIGSTVGLPAPLHHHQKAERATTAAVQNVVALPNRSTATDVLQAVPGLQAYLGRGYDLVSGSPCADGTADPGFLVTQPIFDLSSFEQGQTVILEGEEYDVPDDVIVTPVGSCAYAASDVTVAGARSFQTAQQRGITLGAGLSLPTLFGASFTASSTYRDVQEQSEQFYRRFVDAAATCELYQAQVANPLFTPPSLTAAFKNAVALLPQSYEEDPEIIKQLLSTFGTHYAERVMFGGQMVVSSVFEADAWAHMREQEWEIGANAQVSFLIFSLSFGGSDSERERIEQQFDSQRSSYTERYLGGTPFVGGNASAWAEGLMQNPAPIRTNLALQPISTLLTSVNFPDDEHIDAKAAALVEGMEKWVETMYPAFRPFPGDPEPADPMFPLPNPPDMPSNMVDQFSAAAEVDEVVYVFGGWLNGATARDWILSYNVYGGEWMDTGVVLQTPLAGIAGATHNKAVFLFGGARWLDRSGADAEVTNEIQIFNPQSSSTRPAGTLPKPLFHMCAAETNQVIWLFGGVHDSAHRETGEWNEQAFMYDPISEEIIQTIEMTEENGYTGTRNVIACGAVSSEQVLLVDQAGVTHSLDPETRLFHRFSAVMPRNGGGSTNYLFRSAGAVLNNRLYVTGGMCSVAGGDQNGIRQVAYFEPNIDAWSVGMELPNRGRGSHAVVPIDGQLMLLSGLWGTSVNDRETAVYYIT